MRKVHTDDTREVILDTAKTLLRRFGGNKMTVVDIARSMGMSHANVYRFFRTKAEILDAIVDEWLSKVEAFIEGIAERPDSASARIEAVVLELHRKRREKLLQDAELYETYRRVMELRPDVIAKRRQKILGVFKRLLESGVETGEFEPVDCQTTAVVLEDATALFLHPLMLPVEHSENAEPRARNVVHSILAGFSPRPRTTASRARRLAAS